MSINLRSFFVVALLVPVLFVALGYSFVYAGFGITPPYVTNTSLTRNSTYEQQILLVRSDPDTDQKAEVTIDAPEIESWLEIVQGEDILLPKGEQKVPMTVRVRVPEDAEFKNYTGKIRIRTLPADGQVAAGSVSISLGALVDVKLSVIDKQITDFRVRKVSVSDLNEGKKVAWLFFPGKIRFSMMLENTGNVDVSPSKVEFRIYDRGGRVLLEETQNLGKVTKIAPYKTDTVVASLPTRLPADSYLARYRIFNGDEVKQEGELTLNVVPAGTLEAAGFGFSGLSVPHKISILLPIFAIIIAVLYVLYIRRQRRAHR